METVHVDLGVRSYPIFIGSGISESAELFSRIINSKQVLIVSNDSIAPLYMQKIVDQIGSLDHAPTKLDTLTLPDGEQYKNLETLNLIFDYLLENRFDRSACLIALGGGVIGDMVGFAAACYQRGIKFIQVPTTILSQVDSSVGGKTAVNHALGKNMIGAFYQPQSVLIDIEMIKTLPMREVAAGIAEVIKYGLIYDQSFFLWLEENIEKLNNLDSTALTYAIKRSCEIKAAVVAEDETEAGIRAILNLGHTYGHAIEAKLGYGKWLHGEAVAAGMVMACDLSIRLGWLEETWLKRVSDLLSRASLPIAPPESMTVEMFLDGMSVDKKVSEGKLRLVLLKDIGKAVVTSEFDQELFKQQLEQICA